MTVARRMATLRCSSDSRSKAAESRVDPTTTVGLPLTVVTGCLRCQARWFGTNHGQVQLGPHHSRHRRGANHGSRDSRLGPAVLQSAGNTSPLSSPVDSALITTPLSLKGIAAIPFQDAVASFTADVGATASDFTATIVWGDQSTSSGTVVPGPGGFVVSGSHNYAQSATNLPIMATIVDARDLTQVVAHSLIDVAPSPLQAFTQTPSFTEGTAASRVVATFTDSLPGSFAGQFTAAIGWGDNQTSAGTISADGAGFDVTGTHTYIQAGTGTYSIVVLRIAYRSSARFTWRAGRGRSGAAGEAAPRGRPPFEHEVPAHPDRQSGQLGAAGEVASDLSPIVAFQAILLKKRAGLWTIGPDDQTS